MGLSHVNAGISFGRRLRLRLGPRLQGVGVIRVLYQDGRISFNAKPVVGVQARDLADAQLVIHVFLGNFPGDQVLI